MEIQEIKKENIQKRVMSEIKKAKKEILATMNVSEEQNSPLPKKYFALLKKKAGKGIKIKRIVFGSFKEYRDILSKFKNNELLFIGKRTKSKNYKRMVMIDGAKLFFRNKGKFHFTTSEKYIKQYKTYFNKFN